MFYLELEDDLELALLTEAHSRVLFELIESNRDYLRAWLPWIEGAQTINGTHRLIRFGLRQYARSAGMNAAVWFQNQLAGVISYNYIDHARRQTELGYWLGVDFQGKGLMTAACRAMTTYAFAHFRLERVEIRCAVNNTRSRAVPERLGFAMSDTVPQLDWASDHFVQTIVYSMTAEAWQEKGAIHDSASRRRWQF